MSFFKLLEATQEEIDEISKQRKFTYGVSFAVLLVIAIFVPERYAVLCFLGAIITTLFEISRKLHDIYFVIRLKADVIITMLDGIANR
jgi:hypothetical protein